MDPASDDGAHDALDDYCPTVTDLPRLGADRDVPEEESNVRCATSARFWLNCYAQIVPRGDAEVGRQPRGVEQRAVRRWARSRTKMSPHARVRRDLLGRDSWTPGPGSLASSQRISAVGMRSVRMR